MLVCLVATGCAAPVDDLVPLPEPLVGTWRTDEPRYQDRTLALAPTRIVLGTGGGTEVRYTVGAIHQNRDDFGLLYTIEYRDVESVEYRLSFYFEAEGGGTIRLKNQPTIAWRKSSP